MNSRRSPVGTFASWTCTRNMAPSRQTSSSPDLRTTSPSTSSRPSLRKGTATSPKSRTPSRRSAARPHVGLCGNASKSWRSRGSSCPRPDRGDEPIASPRSSSRSGHKCSVSPNTRTSLFREKETQGERNVGRKGKGTPTRAGERKGDLRHLFGEDARPPEQLDGFDLREGRVREIRAGGRELLYDPEEERDDGRAGVQALGAVHVLPESGRDHCEGRGPPPRRR